MKAGSSFYLNVSLIFGIALGASFFMHMIGSVDLTSTKEGPDVLLLGVVSCTANPAFLAFLLIVVDDQLYYLRT